MAALLPLGGGDVDHSPGDTAFALTSTALVLMMTIPGLALFYGGMSRAPNVLNTVMQSFVITCEVTVLWIAMGYSLAFGKGHNPFIGGSERFWLLGLAPRASNLAACGLKKPRTELSGNTD
ncbi:ammonium transporter AmtB-like domain-containing protein [Baffinella frigidus]|nr:ammonium transporter AmtB-like domain-containing protein [Cryptophyta sp. CCMP2293]